MNRFVILIFAMAATAAIAQDVRPYEPMLVDGRSWTYRYSKDMMTETVCGDTILEGEVCKKILCKYEKSGKEWYNIAKEENGKVYNYFKWDKNVNGTPVSHYKWCLVYDFNVSVGHAFPVDDFITGEYVEDWTVTEDEYIESCGRKWRRLKVEGKYDNYYHIEGIGPYFYDDFGFSIMYITGSESSFFYTPFIECRQGDEVIFKAEDIEAPASPSGVESVAVEDAQGGGMIYDIYGRRVEHPQRGHIYIRDGRKFVQR